MTKLKTLPLVACAGLLVTLGLYAQQINVGNINGSVTDPTGAIVPGADVVAVSSETNVAYPTVTTSAGLYSISLLPVGRYSVTVTKAGFQKATRENVAVISGQTFTVDFVLRVGSTTQTITVTGTPPIVNATDTHQGITQTQEELQDLPISLEGSAALAAEDVIQAYPGVNFIDQGSRGQGWMVISRGEINGIQGYEGYDIDGVEAGPGEAENGEDFIAPVPDQIQEVRLTYNTDASQGFNGGVAIDMVTKSGTNKVHGDVYYYNRNDALEARNFYISSVNKDKQNESGVTLGGPVYIPKVYDGRNKTFFFGSVDVYRLVTTTQLYQAIAVATVPTLAERTGNFQDQLGAQIGTDELGRPIYKGEIYDPNTTRLQPDGTYIRDPFTYNGQLNVIPPSSLSSVSQAFGSNYSAPTGPGIVNNWVGAASPSFVDKNQWSLKLDHTIGQKHRLTFSAEKLFTAGINTFPGNGSLQNPGCESGHININGINGYTDPLIGYNADEDCRNMYRYRLHYTATVNPNVLFDFMAGVTRDPGRNQLALPAAADNEGCAAGLKGTQWCMTPQVNIENVSPFGSSNLGNFEAHSQRTPFSVSMHWMKGKHQFAFGADYLSEPYVFGYNYGAAGYFSFTHYETALPGVSGTGAGIASFYAGQADTGSVFSGVRGRLATSEAALYAQDKWRVTNKLTFDYGLRWELTVPPRVDDNEISSFDPSQSNPGAGGILGALSFYGFGPGRNGRTQVGNYYFKAFAPKIGLSYAFDPKTVFRANFGISYFPQLEKYLASKNVFTPTDGFSATFSSNSTNTGITPAFNWQNGFPIPFPTFPDINSTLLNNGNTSYLNINDNRAPMVENLGAEVERQLPGQMTLSVGYVGTLAHRMAGTYNLNTLPLQYLSLGSLLNDSITSPQAVAAGIPLPYPGFTGSVAQALTPYPQYRAIWSIDAQLANSSYHSLQMSVQRHFGSLTFLAAFTGAKFLDMADNGGNGAGSLKVQSIYARQTAKSLATASQTGDIPKELSLSWYWSVPVGRGKRFLGNTSKVTDALLGNWRVSGIQYYQAGVPLQLSSNEIIPASGGSLSNGGTVTFPTTSWPDLNIGVPIKAVGGCGDVHPSTAQGYYLNKAAFRDPAPFALGNTYELPTVRGCGYFDEDLGLEKGFPFGENRRVALGAIFTDLFNRHQFLSPTLNVDSSAFGTFTNAGNPRTVQIYMKVIF